MREPKPEEDNVITPVRLPREHIGKHESDPIVVADPLGGAIASIAGAASTAVTVVASCSSRSVHVPGPHASSSTSPAGAKPSNAASISRTPGRRDVTCFGGARARLAWQVRG